MTTNHAGPAESQSKASRTEEWLTRREVAARLKKTSRTIDSYIRRGLLPAIKIGRSILLRWSDVEKHLIKRFRIIPKPSACSNESAHSTIQGAPQSYSPQVPEIRIPQNLAKQI